MDNATIQDFLDEHDYDIRKTHNGRWIDQKCTMDVVCLVSDCIVEYTSGRNRKSFTVNDIWYNDYTVDNVQQIASLALTDFLAIHLRPMILHYLDITLTSIISFR